MLLFTLFGHPYRQLKYVDKDYNVPKLDYGEYTTDRYSDIIGYFPVEWVKMDNTVT